MNDKSNKLDLPAAPATDKGTIAPAKVTNDLRNFVNGESMKKQFALALPKVLPVDRFVRCLITTLNRTPELLSCDKNSVLAGAMTCAQLGLEIDPALGRAYLLPFNDKRKGKIAQLIIGYKGYVDLAYRSGLVSGVDAEVVYEKDTFTYEKGLNPKLVHIPSDSEDAGDLKYAYCIVWLSNGGKIWRVLNRGEVMRHKKYSRAAGSEYSPWNTNEAAMWRKSAIRDLAGLIPQSPELQMALTADADDARAPEAPLPTDFSDMTNVDASPEGMAVAAGADHA
jgi:recombination protein RecT